MIEREELDLRALRYFVAVAEELSFTRAAARCLIAQQALSRHIQALERRLGVALFIRSTRRVSLTPEGEAMLDRARQLLALHDLLLRDMSAPRRPLVADLLIAGPRSALRVIERAMALSPHLEVRRRYGGGMGTALSRLLTGEIDLAFGRAQGLGQDLPAGIESRLARLAPIGLLLPETHPLAVQAEVPMAHMNGLEIDAGIDTRGTPEWVDFARQLTAQFGVRPTAPHEPAEGLEDTAVHLREQGLPILSEADFQQVEGGVMRPLVSPIPLYPWSVVYRRGGHGGIDAILEAVDLLAASDGWLDRPEGAWLPEPEVGQAVVPADASRAGPRHPRPG
jgi:DNA-binding transcriptional LysR family regulator